MTRLNDFQNLGDILEPYDPDYLSNKPYEVPELPRWERRLYKKISILEGKLQRARVKYDFDSDTMEFVIERQTESGYAMLRYVGFNSEDNEYYFGTEDEELVYGSSSAEIVEAAVRWQNAKLIKKH